MLGEAKPNIPESGLHRWDKERCVTGAIVAHQDRIKASS